MARRIAKAVEVRKSTWRATATPAVFAGRGGLDRGVVHGGAPWGFCCRGQGEALVFVVDLEVDALVVARITSSFTWWGSPRLPSRAACLGGLFACVDGAAPLVAFAFGTDEGDTVLVDDFAVDDVVRVPVGLGGQAVVDDLAVEHLAVRPSAGAGPALGLLRLEAVAGGRRGGVVASLLLAGSFSALSVFGLGVLSPRPRHGRSLSGCLPRSFTFRPSRRPSLRPLAELPSFGAFGFFEVLSLRSLGWLVVLAVLGPCLGVRFFSLLARSLPSLPSLSAIGSLVFGFLWAAAASVSRGPSGVLPGSRARPPPLLRPVPPLPRPPLSAPLVPGPAERSRDPERSDAAVVGARVVAVRVVFGFPAAPHQGGQRSGGDGAADDGTDGAAEEESDTDRGRFAAHAV
jgi:hypothetical protein